MTPNRRLKQAIVAQVQGSGVLRNYVAQDPTNSALVAFWGARRQQQTPVYPAIAYRLTGRPEDRFTDVRVRNEAASVDIDSTVGSPLWVYRLEITVWDDRTNDLWSDAICDELHRIFHNRSFPIDGGRCFKSELVSENRDQYTDITNTWFSLMLFQMRVHLSI